MIAEHNYISILTENLPNHWETFRMGAIFVERIEKVNDVDFSPLSVTMKGIVPQLENIAKTTNGDNRKRVCVNDFVINSRSDRKGSGGMSKYDGSVSLINTVLKPNKKYSNRYTNYLLTNVLFQEEFYKFGKGIVDDMWSTKYFDMKYIKVPCPPKQEQIAIANYLDSQSEKIKHFIKNKTRLIELLKEQRQEIINQSVTKGIGGCLSGAEGNTTKMKDSGIDWLGDIPEHWEIRRLKYLTKESLQYGLNIESKSYKSVGIRFLRTTDINSNGELTKEGIYLDESSVSEEYLLRKGDVLFSRSGTIGRGYFHDTDELITYAGFLVRFRLEDIEMAKWVYYYSLTAYFKYVINSKAIENTIQNFNGQKYNNIFIPLPPKKEQSQIVSHIKTETAKIDQAIAKTQKEIALIKEYKEAMIAEAVVGKLKMSKL